MFEKLIVDGKVAVLYSPGFGAGWSMWAHDGNEEAMAMDRDLVEAFFTGGVNAVVKVAEKKYPDNYTGGAEDLKVVWLPVGTKFMINEYDGSESLITLDEMKFFTA